MLTKIYKILSYPLRALFTGVGTGPTCRFHPTCSAYAGEAIKTHGILKGGYLSIKRICRCHPFAKRFEHDPVPQKANPHEQSVQD